MLLSLPPPSTPARSCLRPQRLRAPTHFALPRQPSPFPVAPSRRNPANQKASLHEWESQRAVIPPRIIAERHPEWPPAILNRADPRKSRCLCPTPALPPPLTPPPRAGKSSPPDGLGRWLRKSATSPKPFSVSALRGPSRVRFAGLRPPLTDPSTPPPLPCNRTRPSSISRKRDRHFIKGVTD